MNEKTNKGKHINKQTSKQTAPCVYFRPGKPLRILTTVISTPFELHIQLTTAESFQTTFLENIREEITLLLFVI